MARKNEKQMTGFVSGAWCSSNSNYYYPTHSLVTLDNKAIKAILKKMDRVKFDKTITSVNTNLGYCEYFHLHEPSLEKVASMLGVTADALSNIDTKTFLPIFHEVDLMSTDLVEEYRTGGHVDTEIYGNYVVWKAQEKSNGANMESPCIDRHVLEKWLKGDFT